LAPKDLCNFSLVPVSFVVRADEFLSLDQLVNNLPIEPRKVFREALAENLKPAMPTPEIPHPVPRIVPGRRLALHIRDDVTFGPLQKPCPDSIPPKHRFKLGPLTLSDPEPAVDDEPRRSESLRRPLHLGDDFLRHRSRSLLIARKVHRVLSAALGR